MPTKCERGTKCYFVPRALKSPLTTSRGLSSLALPSVLVQEIVFAGCFFRFAPYGRALVGARCGYMPHKPLGTAQTAKCGKMLPLKRKQGEKCYFSPCAFISKSYQQPLYLTPTYCRRPHTPHNHTSDTSPPPHWTALSPAGCVWPVPP